MILIIVAILGIVGGSQGADTQLEGREIVLADGQETIKKEKVEQDIEVHLGYIKRLYEESGKIYLDIDYIQVFSGKKAQKASEEDGIKYDHSGFYIRNASPEIKNFEISDNAEITVLNICRKETQEESWMKSHVLKGPEPEPGGIGVYKVTYDELKSLGLIDFFSYVIQIKDNKVIEIAEGCLP